MSESSTDTLDVLIVGAGVSGIGAARHLQMRSPQQSFALIEAREDLGGTWDLFRYPGVRSDSDMYTFGYAFKPWLQGKVFADGPSIKAYVREAAEEAGIVEKIRFGCRMERLNWSSEENVWTVDVRNTSTGDTDHIRARFVVLCSGYYRYDQGYKPDFPGEGDFEGDIIHPQLWPKDYDYTGKRVVIIGSGATAVTLLPSMTETAEHVTLLQRSPTYIAPRPTTDPVADVFRKILPGKIAYSLSRAKNILISILFFQIAQIWPDWVRKQVKTYIRQELGEEFDIDRHFTPKYKPWDERFCVAPDGDFFKALATDKADIATDDIETFTRKGIRLKSGAHIDADLIIPATGLDMQLAGGAETRVDGRRVIARDCVSYRGMMLSQLPNLALAFGYTNASWTLKIDLTCERVCRLLNYMDREGYAACMPVPPENLETQPLLNLSSGYIKRAESWLPRQGFEAPWRTYQNYVQDMLTIRYGQLDDGALHFYRPGELAPPTAARPDEREAAE
ncbi:flavin-containing monooxygenase [Maricaulis sp. D1M11]|uniref:flavin-containing monooxygenase n=1 Tax=Maricaulis sp. D1M11 TaxID=3076117 RepID=UPI0039B4164B